MLFCLEILLFMLVACANISDFEELKILVSRFDFLEIRLDLCRISLQEVKEIFSQDKRLIATFRANSQSDENRIAQLRVALRSGAEFIDLDINSDIGILNLLRQDIIKNNTKLILSYHSVEEVMTAASLQSIIERISSWNPYIIKIASLCQKPEDVIDLLELYKKNTDHRLILLPVGEGMEFARILSLQAGASFIYCSSGRGQETAKGQLTQPESEKILNLLLNEKK